MWLYTKTKYVVSMEIAEVVDMVQKYVNLRLAFLKQSKELENLKNS